MSDSKDTGEKKLTLGGKGRLELKKSVGTGQVRQSFSHGRSKTVQVEVKRKRRFDRTDGDARSGAAGEDVPSFSEGLSEEERLARVRALEGAAKEEERRKRELEESERRAEEARKKREEEAKRQAEEEARRKAEEEEAAQAAPESAEEARKPSKSAKVEKAAAEEPAPIPMTEEEALAAAQAAKARAAKEKSRDTDEDEEKASRARDKERKEQEKRATMRLKGEPRRRQGKLNVTQIMEDGEDEAPRGRSLAALRRAREKERIQAQAHRERNEKVVREVVVPEAITVGDLANRMAERAADVIKSLMKMGVMATVNQSIDQDTAELVIEEFGHRIRRISESDVEDALVDTGEEKEVGRVPRPPVVTVMGHVDHGKTSLLDALRATDVAAGEAGGITQHIGAYQVKLSSGDQITFLDTPGHEAFTSMRMRGAKVTDIVVLVVAADDGLQPQTREAIAHAKAAAVPMIVAINKIDKPEADPLRVKNQLLEESIVIEDLGGDVQCIEVSAKERLNLDKLEEAILLQAEILELKANPERRAKGAIIEAKLEKGRGSVATVLIQTGTLHVGDVFVAGAEWGRVRALIDDKGRQIESAGPSAPVEVLGLQGTPQAGDDFAVLEDEAKVREISDYRQRKQKEQSHALAARGTLEQMFNQIKAGEIKELPVVVKTDVQGSLEALTAALQKIGTEEVKVRVLHGAVGGITESDVTLAASTGGIVIGFNVRANPQARDMARRDGVDIRYYSIIYDVIDDAKSIMGGLLAPEEREKFLGYAQIREVFNVTKVGKIAGCMVTDGMVKRGAKVRLLRDDVVIYEGALKQLKRFKDDVREVQSGYECGMAFENYDDIKQGDVVECFEVEEIAREL